MKWMKLAIEEALKAKLDIPVGCVIICEEKVIARSHNEVELRRDATAHAEILCIQRACGILNRRNLSDCTLICTLEPCKMCEEAIKLARINKVMFGAFADNSDCDYKIDWIGGIMENECSKLIKQYFFSIRK